MLTDSDRVRWREMIANVRISNGRWPVAHYREQHEFAVRRYRACRVCAYRYPSDRAYWTSTASYWLHLARANKRCLALAKARVASE